MARSVTTNVTKIVFRKNFNYAVLNVTTLAGKTGHFFRAVKGDSHDIAPFKFTKLRLSFILNGNNIIIFTDDRVSLETNLLNQMTKSDKRAYSKRLLVLFLLEIFLAVW